MVKGTIHSATHRPAPRDATRIHWPPPPIPAISDTPHPPLQKLQLGAKNNEGRPHPSKGTNIKKRYRAEQNPLALDTRTGSS